MSISNEVRKAICITEVKNYEYCIELLLILLIYISIEVFFPQCQRFLKYYELTISI